MLRALLRDSVLYSLPSLISRGIGLILVPLYTRVLSPADFGSLDLLLVFASLVNLTVALEISQGIARFYGSEKDATKKAAYAATAWWFTFGAYTLFAAVAIANVGRLSPFVLGRNGLENVFLIGVGYIWCFGLYHLAVNQFRWDLRSRQYVTASIIMTVVTAISSVAMVYGLRLGLAGLLAGMAIGAAVGLGYSMVHLHATLSVRAIDRDALSELLRFSIPLVPASIAVFVGTYIDRIMINELMDIASVGLYGIGFRIASIVGLIVVGFQGALTPLLYVHHAAATTPSELARIFRWFIAVVVVGVSTLAMFAEPITRLFATEVFAAAWVVVAPLALANLLGQMYVFAPGIAIKKKTQLLFYISALAAIINVCLTVLLVPILGIVGAAIATLAGNLTAFTIQMLHSQNLYPVPHEWKLIGSGAVIGIVTTAIVLAVPTSNVLAPLLGPLGLAFIVLALLRVGIVRPAEARSGLDLVARGASSLFSRSRR